MWLVDVLVWGVLIKYATFSCVKKKWTTGLLSASNKKPYICTTFLLRLNLNEQFSVSSDFWKCCYQFGTGPFQIRKSVDLVRNEEYSSFTGVRYQCLPIIPLSMHLFFCFTLLYQITYSLKVIYSAILPYKQRPAQDLPAECSVHLDSNAMRTTARSVNVMNVSL